MSPNLTVVIVAFSRFSRDPRIWKSVQSYRRAGARIVGVGLQEKGSPTGGMEYHSFPEVFPRGGPVAFAIRYLTFSLFTFMVCVGLALRLRRDVVLHVCNPPTVLLLACAPLFLKARARVLDIHEFVPLMVEEKFGKRASLWAVGMLDQGLGMAFSSLCVFVDPVHARRISQALRVYAPSLIIPNTPMRGLINPVSGRLPSGPLKFIYPGAMAFGRDLDLLVYAFKSSKLQAGGATLLMLGDGPMVPALRKMVRDEGLERVVLFQSAVEYPRAMEMIAQADVGLVPAPRSAMAAIASPNKLNEFLSLGLPVLASDTDRFRSLVGSRIDYFIPGDSRSMRTALEMFLDRNYLEARRVEAAQVSIRCWEDDFEFLLKQLRV